MLSQVALAGQAGFAAMFPSLTMNTSYHTGRRVACLPWSVLPALRLRLELLGALERPLKVRRIEPVELG